jgi:hypothetical protein
MSAPEPLASGWLLDTARGESVSAECYGESVSAEFAGLYAWLQRFTVETRAGIPLRAAGFDSPEAGNPRIEKMMVENRPPLAISAGGGYRKPQFVWETPIEVLRRPSGRVPGVKLHQARFGGSLGTSDLMRVNYLETQPWLVWEPRITKRRGRPPIADPSPATLRKRKQRKRERVLTDTLKDVQTSLARIENKIDHEQALTALRFGRLLAKENDTEDAWSNGGSLLVEKSDS